MQTLEIAHSLSTLYMTGVIWFVQLVQYPLMLRIGSAEFRGYHAAYTQRMGLVVGVPMLVEAGSAALLAARAPGDPLALVGLGLVAFLWISTFAVQVPYHRQLEKGGYDATAIRRLCRTNWLRTFAWSARGGLVLALMHG